jgi:hypothetical protein
MSTHSICFAGLSREEEAEIVTRFKQANARVGKHWMVTPETEADVLVIDMDSMYGQMSLMKAIGTGKILVALTASGRAETDHVLQRPVTVDALVELFERISSGAGTPPADAENFPPANAMPAPAPAPEPVWTAAVPTPVAATPTAASPPAAAAEIPSSAKVTAELPVVPAAKPADPRLADYLRPGALPGPVRLQLAGAPDLVLDPSSQTYLAGSSLKPLLPYCTAILRDDDLHPLVASELPALAASLGGSQPWSRLAWLCALTGGNGALAAGYGPNDKYKLLKWPQTEREFPKHFRIATVMMKGPANLTEIAEQSGSSLIEVIDFVNACLATGVAEPDLPPPANAEAAKGGGLLGRFRR